MSGIEECMAMSEDGDWYAFPPTWTRAEVISAVAEMGDGWRETLRRFSISRGHVRPWSVEEDEDDFGEPGWLYPCNALHPAAQPAWLVAER